MTSSFIKGPNGSTGWLVLLRLMSLSLLTFAGCQSASSSQVSLEKISRVEGLQVIDSEHLTDEQRLNEIVLAAFNTGETVIAAIDERGTGESQDEKTTEKNTAKNVDTDLIPPGLVSITNELPSLESIAVSANPKLIRLEQEANAASARSRYVDKLPDPTFGANVFGNPIETAAGSQRANLSLAQKIPWLERLDAQQQQAIFVAMSLRQKYAAERLRIIGDVRAQYFRLYVLTRQIETVEANQKLLVPLIEIISARVATGKATQGDVLLGILEVSRLEEQLITLRQQVISAQAGINRLVNRSVSVPIAVPEKLEVTTLGWTHDMLVQTSFEKQPVIAAAQLQANASRWGVNVAELRRRPDIQIGAAWFFMDDNRPPSSVVKIGRDAWSLGAAISIPLDRDKYDAIRDEALWEHAATQANVNDVRLEFDSRLLDLLEQAKAASETASLYQDTIIPQSEQTLSADLESLTAGAVEFDRVIRDFRNLLTLKFGYHRSVGQLAIAVARIRQAVGVDIQPQPALTSSPPIAPLETTRTLVVLDTLKNAGDVRVSDSE